jgi:hypothetical protein
MPKVRHAAIAIYRPPLAGLPYLSVLLIHGEAPNAVAFDTEAEALAFAERARAEFEATASPDQRTGTAAGRAGPLEVKCLTPAPAGRRLTCPMAPPQP